MVPMSLTGYEAIPAEFSNDDWKRILHALQSYVIHQESSLKTKNVGDKEWQDLDTYSSIARDIEYFIILKEHE